MSGTCVRDYVHVSDVTDAHVEVVKALENGVTVEPNVLNFGTGVGVSVRQAVEAASSAIGAAVDPVIMPQRLSDPPDVLADVTRIQKVLGWSARRGLPEIIGSQWEAQYCAETRTDAPRQPAHAVGAA